MSSLRADLRAAVEAARDRAEAAGELRRQEGAAWPPISLERPGRPEHGDYATNAAMQLAPVVRDSPMRIAETLKRHLGLPPGIAEVSVVPPGFLNMRLDPAWVAAQATLGATEWGGRPLRVFVDTREDDPRVDYRPRIEAAGGRCR